MDEKNVPIYLLATLTYTICFKRSYVDDWIISSEKTGRMFTMLKACWIKIWEDVETGLSWFQFVTIGSRDDRFSNLRSTWSWSKRLWKRGEIYGKKIWENLHIAKNIRRVWTGEKVCFRRYIKALGFWEKVSELENCKGRDRDIILEFLG